MKTATRSWARTKLALRNGIIVDTNHNPEGWVEVVYVPPHYKGNWKVGNQACLYYGSCSSPSEWLGGAYGTEYDVIMVIKEIDCEM
jgi:hypothetical protein